MSNNNDEYGRYCSDKLYYLKKTYPFNFWAAPEEFFYGNLLNYNLFHRWYTDKLWLRFWINAIKIRAWWYSPA